MARKKGTGIFFPLINAEIPGFYNQAVTELALLAAKYGISPATVAEMQAHNVNVQAVYTQAVADDAAAQVSTRIKNNVFADAKLDLLRVFNIINKAANFSEEDAEALGFRVVTQAPDLSTIKPVVTNIVVKENQVIIDWVRGHMQGVVVFGSYDGKKFAEIGRDTRSPYEDTRKNLIDQPEERYYKLQYMKNDKLIGDPTAIEKAVVAIF